MKTVYLFTEKYDLPNKASIGVKTFKLFLATSKTNETANMKLNGTKNH